MRGTLYNCKNAPHIEKLTSAALSFQCVSNSSSLFQFFFDKCVVYLDIDAAFNFHGKR